MNGKDIFLSLKYVGEDLIEKAEYGEFPTKAEKNGKKTNARKLIRRPLLVTAIIAMLMMLVGCAVVYVLNLNGIKIGDQINKRDVFEYDPNTGEAVAYVGQETYIEEVFTVAGLQGTPAYQAACEWFEFKQSYDPDMVILGSVWGNEPKFPAEYGSYNIYTQEMKDKLDEIVAKYDLKLAGGKLEFRTLRNMCHALGIEKFQMAQNDVTINVDSGSCRENGNFDLSMNVVFPENTENELTSSWVSLNWNRKDCFTEDVIEFEDTGDWKEWNYTTSSGSKVLITRSPSDWRGYIICDREEAILSLQVEVRRDTGNNVDGKTWWDQNYLTDRQMEQIADAIDFSIQPRVPTREDVDKQPAASNAATQDGCTVELKSVETDGWMVRIVMGITAPEGTVLNRNPHQGFEDEFYNIGSTNYDNFTPTVGTVTGATGGWNDKENHDSLDNTQSLVLERQVKMEDGSAPFGEGAVWNIHFEDIVASYWDGANSTFITDLLTAGEWNFQITFDEENGDYREIEFADEPIIMPAVVGWNLDGTDVYEDVKVTSFALHSMSAAVQYEHDGSAEFKDMYVVMEDGTRIRFQETGGNPGITWYILEQKIDMDKVDHVILPNGNLLKHPNR